MATGRVEIVGSDRGPRRPHRSGLVIGAVFLLVVALGLAERPSDRDLPRPAPVITPVPVRHPAGVTANAVYPVPEGTGDTRRMRVTFPDGSRAELSYPADLNLAALGARPYVAGTLDGADGFRPLTAPLYGEAETSAGRPMIRRLTGNVTLWPGPPGVDDAGAVLLFGFGDWRLALQDGPAGMTFEQRLDWAEHLRGTVTPDGFLTLSAGGPLRLARRGEVRDGVLVGPQLWLGGLSRRMIVLAPVPECGRRMSVVLDPRHTIAGSVCRDGFHLAASGDERFVRTALRHVGVRAL
ncbi:hypothetical protein [Nonomuraea aridisoli]|uniref:Uncharacterized protein n=1 Tax=Nonomuraea aridisoli TaxID=2070368 RepID=A0A2W2E619_9ACTN|nr:hypothetical protein [Nonomuraea aridisoli]PZG05057.1 hypothetical protein C1J01_43880 [Nonomuraea aridisoli]